MFRTVGLTGPDTCVVQVNAGSKAEQANLQPGDLILEINGENTAEMLNAEAQNKIKSSKTNLQLLVERYAFTQTCFHSAFILHLLVYFVNTCMYNVQTKIIAQYHSNSLPRNLSLKIFHACNSVCTKAEIFTLFLTSIKQHCTNKSADCNQGKCQDVWKPQSSIPWFLLINFVLRFTTTLFKWQGVSY